MCYKFSSVSDLIDIKINRNNTFIELLDAQTKILRKQILINHRWALSNQKKQELLKQLNDIEEIQRSEYSLVLQEEIAKLVFEVDESTPEVDELTADIKKLQIHGAELLEKMNALNIQIPDKTTVTNFKVITGNDDCSGFTRYS
jgi:hypothetical protein